MYLVLILFAVVILGVFLNFINCPSPRTFWYLYNMSGPKGWPILGNALELANLKDEEVLDYLMDCARKYPRFTLLWLLGMPMIFMQEPEDIEVLLSSTVHTQKGRDYIPLIPWLNEGLLLSTGQKWHRRRKMLTPSFHFRILDDNLPNISKHAEILTKKMLETKTVDVETFAKLCTLDAICETAMGVDIGAQNNEGSDYVNAIKRIGEIILKRDFTFWLEKDWIFYLTSYGKEFRKLVKYLHSVTEKVISERKKTYVSNSTDNEADELNIKKRLAFLDSLIDHEVKNPNSLNQKDIREEVDTFMFEGHDTTSSAVTYIFFVLANYQDIQDKVVEELYEIFGDSDRSAEMKDVARMTYLEKVIKETLRLYPPVPYISRSLTTDMILRDGTRMPAGVSVAVLPFGIHRDPRIYPDPEKFDPERFSEAEAQKRHPFAYIPFSAGPRNCIGQKFAMMEIKIIVATVLRKSRVESVTQMSEVKHAPLMILRPNVPIYIKVTPRENLSFRMQ